MATKTTVKGWVVQFRKMGSRKWFVEGETELFPTEGLALERMTILVKGVWEYRIRPATVVLTVQ